MCIGTCREQILSIAKDLAPADGDTFTPAQLVDEMRSRGSRYAASTIRTHVTSLMCVNAPNNHGTTYHDLERIDHGVYRLIHSTNKKDKPVVPEPLSEETLAEVPAGNSDVQRRAETVALHELSTQFGFKLAPERMQLPSGVRVEVDGVSHEPPVLVEVWAHQGRPKAAQRNKVLADALKLHYIDAVLDGGFRKILCLTDVAAAAPFLGTSWSAAAIEHAQIDVEVVDLPNELRDELWAAQKRQFR